MEVISNLAAVRNSLYRGDTRVVFLNEFIDLLGNILVSRKVRICVLGEVVSVFSILLFM